MAVDSRGGFEYEEFRNALRNIVADAVRRQLEIGLDQGTATGGTSTTLEDTTKDWGTDQFVNAYIEITAGTGEGQIRQIESNTSDTITVATAWTTVPDETSEYRIFGAPATIRKLESIDTEASEVSDRISGSQPRDATIVEDAVGLATEGTLSDQLTRQTETRDRVSGVESELGDHATEGTQAETRDRVSGVEEELSDHATEGTLRTVADRVSGSQPRVIDGANIITPTDLQARYGEYSTLWDSYTAASGESVSGAVDNYGRVTLYSWVSGATQLTVEASPDDGGHWFEIPESPLGPYAADEEDANVIDYNMNLLRLTTQSGVTQTHQLRGLF